jgi:uncharacterized protein (TIGR01244 family)
MPYRAANEVCAVSPLGKLGRSGKLVSRLALIAVALAVVAGIPATAWPQQFTKPDQITRLSAPVILELEGLFQARSVRVGEDMFIAGQPTERALREARAQGVTTVINMRPPDEMQAVPFDEAELVAKLGMRYVYLPVRGNTKYPYTPQTLAAFTEAVRTANGKVLLHCTVAWRASHLWAAYLIKERGIPVEEALANARAINLMDDHRMGSNGRQPVEDFLDRSLPTLGRPPKP